MGNLDDIFRDNFGEERSSLPADQENQLWDNIVDELGDENSIPASSRKFFSTRFIIALIFLAMIPFAFYLGRQSINENEITENESSSELIEKKSDFIDRSIVSSDVNGTDIQNGQQIEIKESKLSQIGNQSLESDHLNPTDKNKNISADENHYASEKMEVDLAGRNRERTVVSKNGGLSLSKQTSNRQNASESREVIAEESFDPFTEKVGQETITLIEETGVNNPVNGAWTSQEEVKQNDVSEAVSEKENVESKQIDDQISTTQNNQFVTSNFLRRMEIPSIEGSFENLVPTITKLSNFEPIVREDNKSVSPWKVGITVVGGANRSGFNYSGSNSALSARKNTTEEGYYGSVFGTDLSLIYKTKWIVNTGIHYEIQRTIYKETFNNDVSRDVKDVVGILVNSQSYEVLDEYERDTTLVFSSVTKIKQINSFSSFTIPIQVGYQWNRKSFSYGMKAGSTLRIRSSQNGELLDTNQELVDLDSGLDLFYNRINIGVNASPFVEYHLNKNWAFLASYNLDLYKPVISLDQSLELYNITQSIKLGLQYYFN